MKLNKSSLAILVLSPSFLVVIFSCSISLVGEDSAPKSPSAHLFEYLSARIGEQNTIFLLGEKIDFLVSREHGKLIRISPLLKERVLNKPTGYLVYFVSEYKVHSQSSICAHTKSGSTWRFGCRMMEEDRKEIPHDRVQILMGFLKNSMEGKLKPTVIKEGQEI